MHAHTHVKVIFDAKSEDAACIDVTVKRKY